MPKATVAERKAKEREWKKAKGLIRREYWIYPQDADKIQKYVEKLNKSHS